MTCIVNSWFPIRSPQSATSISEVYFGPPGTYFGAIKVYALTGLYIEVDLTFKFKIKKLFNIIYWFCDLLQFLRPPQTTRNLCLLLPFLISTNLLWILLSTGRTDLKRLKAATNDEKLVLITRAFNKHDFIVDRGHSHTDSKNSHDKYVKNRPSSAYISQSKKFIQRSANQNALYPRFFCE